MDSAPDQAKQAMLRAIWRDKLHVAPRALELSVPSVRRAFDHILAPADNILGMIDGLPVGLLSLWHASQGGHVVMSHLTTRYEPATYTWRTGDLQGVAQVCIADLVNEPATVRIVLLRLLDHLLGSNTRGAFFSQGAGASPTLSDAAARFLRINALGYGHDRLSVASAYDYFVATWALYLTEPRQLNVMDPQMFRLFRDRLMNPRFWLDARP